MKNQITSFEKSIKTPVKRTFNSLFLLFLIGTCIGQSKINYGITVSRTSTGNGFGAFYNPGISVCAGNSQFELTANVQQLKMNFSGAQVNYQYKVLEANASQGDRLGLFAFGSINYISDAHLSASWAALEQKVARDRYTDYSALKFTTLETYLGFGAKYALCPHIKIHSAIGIGGWHTLEGQRQLYRDYNSQSLTLRVGMVYSFN